MLKTQILHNGRIVSGRFEDLTSRHTTVWLDAFNLSQQELAQVAAHVGTSPGELSELLHKNQRPVLQDIGKFTAIVFHASEIQKKNFVIHPHLFLVSKEQKDFISIHQSFSAASEKVNSYSLQRRIEIFQKGSTALLFAALAEIVAQAFEVLDFVSEEIARVEEQVFEPKLSSRVMKQIFLEKKNLIYLQRALSADREVISEIEKAYGQFLDTRQLSDFRLLYSDVTQLIELTSTYRDIIISVVEIHLSAASNNLNVIMKKLTAWAAIILVPTLIAGIYGMNFRFLPAATHPNGFWLALGVMVASVVLLYAYFKHNDWV